MKIALICMVLLLSGVTANAQTTTTTTTTITTAQDDACEMARTGILRHRGRNGGCCEGIGMCSTRDGAIRRCCFWGQRVPVEIGVAQGRFGRWYACVRYR